MLETAKNGTACLTFVSIFGSWFILNPLADSEDMPVRVPHVHLPNIPCHVGRRPSDLESLLNAALVDGVNIVYPDLHPYAFVGRFIAFRAERHLDRALPTTTLTVLAQKDLAIAGTDATK